MINITFFKYIACRIYGRPTDLFYEFVVNEVIKNIIITQNDTIETLLCDKNELKKCIDYSSIEVMNAVKMFNSMVSLDDDIDEDKFVELVNERLVHINEGKLLLDSDNVIIKQPKLMIIELPDKMID